jgi:hypothetical protein
MIKPTKTLLIPGYATGVTRDILRPKLSDMRGFEVFGNIDNCKLFKWGEERNINLLESLNPISAIKLYFEEKQIANSQKIIDKLILEIDSFKPEIIVAHSMGTALLTEVLKQKNFSFIKKIVFVQSDLRLNNENTQTLQELKKNIKLINVWCFWDQALISSVLISGTIPLGLHTSTIFENYFLPLYKKFNLHESSISDKKLLKIVYK